MQPTASPFSKQVTAHRAVVAERVYLVLAGCFIAALVTCNLIFQKFFIWSPFGIYTFEVSVGILPYPITFLLTDVISEIYGRKRANQVVFAGLFASVFVMGIVMLAQAVPQTSWSPVSGAEFNKVFGLFGPAVLASMMAYLAAQFIDIRVFHFWKRKTKGRHLWLRNNVSTISSQFVDTAAVLLLLCIAGAIEWERFATLLENGFLFKVLVALLDTPIAYLVIGGLRRRLGLAPGEEVDLYAGAA